MLVDGRRRKASYRPRPGEEIAVVFAPPQPVDLPAQAIPLTVVYQDPDLVVIDKPPGLVVHPAPGHPTGTVVNALLTLCPDLAGIRGSIRPGIVHRLDKDTSGLLVVAKNDETHRQLEAALRDRQIRREYLALVECRPGARTGTIDAPIGRDRRDRTVHSTQTDKPREAVTHFEIEKELPRHTLLRCRLETGRTHQIRVHLQAIGHPVCGDRQYGGAACGARLSLTRQFLHSARLVFEHPRTGAEVDCESKLPADLRATYAAAAREPASEGPDGG